VQSHFLATSIALGSPISSKISNAGGGTARGAGQQPATPVIGVLSDKKQADNLPLYKACQGQMTVSFYRYDKAR
jgi:hypothetical protein